MKVQGINRSKAPSFRTLCFGICITWAALDTFASEIQLKGTGPTGNVYDSGSGEYLLGTAGRIVGGVVSVPHSHPFIVRLIVKESTGPIGCGGVILTDEWILTAAHCLEDAVSIKVKAGRHNLSKTEKTGQDVDGTQFIYELFNKSVYENDIGLVKVSPKLQFNAYVKAAKLVPAKWNKSGIATVAGWGRTSTAINATSNKILREADVPIMTNEKCRKYYPRNPIYDTNICAGYDAGGKDACLGDSGGPLFVKEGGKEVVVGIVSVGDGCGLPKKPTIYTRVSKYLDYIKKWTGYSGRTSLSSLISENLCQQYEVYLDENRLPPPVKERPRGDNKCAWFDWKGNCDSQSCNRFSFANC